MENFESLEGLDSITKKFDLDVRKEIYRRIAVRMNQSYHALGIVENLIQSERKLNMKEEIASIGGTLGGEINNYIFQCIQDGYLIEKPKCYEITESGRRLRSNIKIRINDGRELIPT